MSRRKAAHRRVIQLSPVDSLKLQAGEISDPVQATHLNDAPPLANRKYPAGNSSQRSKTTDSRDYSKTLSARDQEILDNVPPHYGHI